MRDDWEWVKKAIVYFCKNYTIDGIDLMPFMKQALKNNTPGWLTCEGAWDKTEPGYNFWDCLFYLDSGVNPTYQVTKCKPWTDAEKRMIAKMPKVRV